MSVVTDDTLPLRQRFDLAADGHDLGDFLISEHPWKPRHSHTARAKPGLELRVGTPVPCCLRAGTDGAESGAHANVVAPQIRKHLLFETDVAWTVQHQDFAHRGSYCVGQVWVCRIQLKQALRRAEAWR